MGLVGDNAVVKSYIGREVPAECPVHQPDKVLLQILTDIHGRHLQNQYGVLLRVRLEGNGLEPRFELLLGNILPYQIETVAPKRRMIVLHLAL